MARHTPDESSALMKGSAARSPDSVEDLFRNLDRRRDETRAHFRRHRWRAGVASATRQACERLSRSASLWHT